MRPSQGTLSGPPAPSSTNLNSFYGLIIGSYLVVLMFMLSGNRASIVSEDMSSVASSVEVQHLRVRVEALEKIMDTRVGGAKAPPSPSSPSTSSHLASLHSALAQQRGWAAPYPVPLPEDKCPSSDPAWAVAHNSRKNFDLFTYGRSEFISGYCLRGGDAIFFEEHETDLIISLLRAAPGGATVGNRDSSDAFFHQPWLFDVGSNLGVHTVAVGATGFGVIAIEANPVTAARLHCSIAKNGLSNVALFNAAVVGSDGPTTVCMQVPQAENVGTAFVSTGACAAGATSVPTLTLDHFFSALPAELPPPGVLKMDIEGFELFALRAGTAWLKRSPPPYVLIEVQVSESFFPPSSLTPSHAHHSRTFFPPLLQTPSVHFFSQPDLLKREKVPFQDLISFWLDHGYHGWIPIGGSRSPGPEVSREDFNTPEKADGFKWRMLTCNYNMIFTLAPQFPFELPAKICENTR